MNHEHDTHKALQELLDDSPAPSVELDQRIRQMAQREAPSPAPRWWSWKPALATACVVGIASVVLLPLATPDGDLLPAPVAPSASSMQASPVAQSAADSAPDMNQDWMADTASPAANEVLQAESEPVAAAPAAAHREAASKMAPSQLERLTGSAAARAVPENYKRRLARIGALRDPARTPEKAELRSRTARDSSVAAKRAADDHSHAGQAGEAAEQASDPEQQYQQLRAECQCALPETLAQALQEMASGRYGKPVPVRRNNESATTTD